MSKSILYLAVCLLLFIGHFQSTKIDVVSKVTAHYWKTQKKLLLVLFKMAEAQSLVLDPIRHTELPKVALRRPMR